MNNSTQQEIILVTGKGGVGKSAVAAAIALKKAQQGKKTLLVELGDQSFFADYLGTSTSPLRVGFSPTRLRENLDVAMWSGPSCLKEYALYLLKIESLYKLFFENPVSKALLNIAPALPELSITGKITSHPRKVGPPLDYDVLVVDAFATGHFLALLKAPQGMAEAIQFGPMGEQSKSIIQVLKNPQQTKYVVVSFPEELPVTEALELSRGIEQLVGQRPVQMVNRWVSGLSADSSHGESQFERQMEKVHSRQEWAAKQLAEYSIQKLSFVFESEPWKIVESLSREVEI